MSRSNRKLPPKSWRHPRGHKQAKINNARSKAIPPTSWDDIRHGDEPLKPYRIAQKLAKEGKRAGYIVAVLAKQNPNVPLTKLYKIAHYFVRRWGTKE